MYSYTRIVEVWDGDKIDERFPFSIDSSESLTELQIVDEIVDKIVEQYPTCAIEIELNCVTN